LQHVYFGLVLYQQANLVHKDEEDEHEEEKEKDEDKNYEKIVL
jgi:hypothetical protein